MFGLLKKIKSDFCKFKANIFKKELKRGVFCRFILDKRHISYQNKTVKYTAFYDKRYSSLSVYNKVFPNEEMFVIGDTYVGSYHTPPKRTIATGELDASAIINSDLKLISIPYPHKLHVDIVGFPNEDKAKRLVAQKLADLSSLTLRE